MQEIKLISLPDRDFSVDSFMFECYENNESQQMPNPMPDHRT